MIADNFILATGKYLLTDASAVPKSFDTNRQIFESLAAVIQPGSPTDNRRLALVTVRTVARKDSDSIRPHLTLLVPPIFASVRDPVIPVKLAAEAAFIRLFDVIDEEGRIFDRFVASSLENGTLAAPLAKQMGDYFKRVGLRLGAQARERRDAEGGAGGLGLAGDEADDEKEIWSVGSLGSGEEGWVDS